MRHPRYRLLPDEALEPTSTPAGITLAKQREILRELRALQNTIPAAQFARDDRLAALALSGSVSRRDMARACGLNKSRIDQIIAQHTERLPKDRNAAREETLRRHMPPPPATADRGADCSAAT
jgi:hypothetical protein